MSVAKEAEPTPCVELFGNISDVDAIIKVAKEMKSTCASVRGSITSTESKMKKATIDTKTYSKRTDVAFMLFFNVILGGMSGYCDDVAEAFNLIANGFSLIKSAKKTGDSKETQGRADLEHGLRMLDASSVMLGSLRSQVILLNKFLNRRKMTKVSGSGDVKTALQNLKNSIIDHKKFIGTARGIESITTDFAGAYDTLKSQTSDDELQPLFESGEAYINESKNTFDLFAKVIDAVIEVVAGSSNATLGSLSEECQQSIGMLTESNVTTTAKKSRTLDNADIPTGNKKKSGKGGKKKKAKTTDDL
jgi:hypothetical protein